MVDGAIVHEAVAGAALDVHVGVEELLDPLKLGPVVPHGEDEALRVQLALHLRRLKAAATPTATKSVRGLRLGFAFGNRRGVHQDLILRGSRFYWIALNSHRFRSVVVVVLAFLQDERLIYRGRQATNNVVLNDVLLASLHRRTPPHHCL